MGWDTVRQRLFTPALAVGLGVFGVVGVIGSGQVATGAAPSDLVATPASLDLGSTAVGASSTVLQVTITNVGSAPQQVRGGAPDDLVNFLVGFNRCEDVTLAPNATCIIGYAFRPSSAGAKSTTVTIGRPESRLVFSLSGTGMSNIATTTNSPTPGAAPGTIATDVSTSTTPIAPVPTTAVDDGLANTGPSSSSTIAFAALLVLVAGAVTLMVVRRVAR